MSKLIHSTLEKICLPEKGSIISGPFGSNISSKYFVASGIPVIRGNNLSLTYDKFYDDGFVFVTPEKAEELKCYAIRGDLIFTAAGTLGQVGIIPKNSIYDTYVISNKQIRARLDSGKIDLLYAFYWFSSPWIQKILKNNNKGSTVPLLTLAEVKSLPIVYPESLEEQRRIAKCIDEFSLKIENNNAINDNLAQMLRLLYEQWFYRFEFPNEQNLPYNRTNGELEWNDKLKRHIPKGWKVQTMLSNELFSVISSGVDRFSTKKYYATADIIGTSIGEGSDIEYETRESRANMQPVINSVWFAKMKNSIKHLFLNKEMSSFVDNSILSTGFYGLKCREISFEYIASVVSAPIFEITKDRLSHGATQQGIGDDDMANITLLIPDDATLCKYHEATKGFFAKISNNILENKRLIAIRNFLLPLLMNGQATIVG